MNVNNLNLFILALLFAGVQAGFSQQTINWGTSASPSGNLTYLSDGTVASNGDGTIDSGEIQFHLGYFSNGFTPDQTNFLDWGANFVSVDGPAVEEVSNGIFSVNETVSGIPSAALGQQAYVFAYNDLGLIGTTSGEVLLYREDDFLFDNSPISRSLDINDNPGDSIDDNFTVIWGQVNRSLGSLGGVVTGGGVINSSQGITFEVQSASFVTIPEPSTWLLALTGGVSLLMRRRSRA